MDLTSLFKTIISAVWYLLPLSIIAIILKSPWFKGVLGEWQVNLLIKFFLDKKEYHLIKNVTLATEGGTTQIDHIIVSKHGIFVIETKNMKGWIFGSANQKQWTHKIFKHTSKFQNPLHQNYKHVKTLEALLNIKNDTLFSVIIFVGDSTFKSKIPDNVGFARAGIKYIKNKRNIVFSEDEVTDIIKQIESGRLKPGFKTNVQHVRHVREIVKEKSATKTCSKCGSEMVLRKATKGKNVGNQFWGCSTYPKCRYMTQIDP